MVTFALGAKSFVHEGGGFNKHTNGESFRDESLLELPNFCGLVLLTQDVSLRFSEILKQ